MADVRPAITRSMTLTDFAGWYWLKTELVDLCRVFGLSTTGSKLMLEDRLRRHLAGLPEDAGAGAGRRRKTGAMPGHAGGGEQMRGAFRSRRSVVTTTEGVFTPETVIGEGWKCNPALGAYFRGVVGNGFHFNAAMRDFIHHGAGHTLADAAICYQTSVRPGAPKLPIARQLEYNQHFREFFAAHPKATREQAIAAWWEKRSRRYGTQRRAEA